MNDYNVKLVKFFVREAGSNESYKDIETDEIFDNEIDTKTTENIMANTFKSYNYNINMQTFSNILKYNNTALDVIIVEYSGNNYFIEAHDMVILFENVLCEIKLKIEGNTPTNATLSLTNNSGSSKLSWGEIK